MYMTVFVCINDFFYNIHSYGDLELESMFVGQFKTVNHWLLGLAALNLREDLF